MDLPAHDATHRLVDVLVIVGGLFGGVPLDPKASIRAAIDKTRHSSPNDEVGRPRPESVSLDQDSAKKPAPSPKRKMEH